jgi:opacity protein-like surface antigen
VIAAEGGYVSIRGGSTHIPNMSIDYVDAGTATSVNAQTTSRAGYHMAGALGYRSGPMRYEAELMHQRARIRSFSQNGVLVGLPSGDTTATSGLGNIYYDLQDVDKNWIPYLGIGFGYASVKRQLNTSTTTDLLNGSDGALAGQGIIGVGYHFDNKVTVNMDYRYFRTGKVDYNIRNSLGNNQMLRQKFQTHNLSLGLSFDF